MKNGSHHLGPPGTITDIGVLKVGLKSYCKPDHIALEHHET